MGGTQAELAICISASVLAGLVYGLAGFGVALVATPLLLITLDPKVAVPLVLILSSLTGAIMLIEVWKWIDLRRAWPLMLAGIVGTPPGAYLLLVCDAKTLKLFIGLAVVLTALAMLAGFRRPIRSERWACVPVGLISGLLNGSTGMSGPPVVLFFANQSVEKATFRANLVAYFMALHVAALPSYIAGGLFTPALLKSAAPLAPGALGGLWLGIWLNKRLEESLFRRLALGVVLVSGILAVSSGLGLR